jgi:hypothetical protein
VGSNFGDVRFHKLTGDHKDINASLKMRSILYLCGWK